MAATVTFNRAGMMALTRLIDARVGRIARTLRDICRNKVSVPYPPSSQPGDPAHLRTGAYRRAIFATRVAPMEWVYGVKEVEPDPTRKKSSRGWLGLWLELGTGSHRQPFPSESFSTMPRGSVPMWFGSPREDTETTGHKTSMAPRPVLLPTLLDDGPSVAASLMRGP